MGRARLPRIRSEDVEFDSRLEGAGIDLARPELSLGLPLADERLSFPSEVRLADRGLRLGWRLNSPWKQSPRIGTCLSAFVRLGNADEQRIQMFGGKWGPLGLC